MQHHVVHAKLGGGRRIAIPAELCRQYGLEPGGTLVLEPTESGIMVRPLDEVIQEVQEFFADAAPQETLLSDELIEDRRREAASNDLD